MLHPSSRASRVVTLCSTWLVATWLLAAAAPAASPGLAAAAPPPDTQSLIRQLGDDDFKVREAATAKLKAMGEDALAALKDAIKEGGDPEVCSRADTLVRQIERPRVPSDWLGADGFGGRGFSRTQVTTSVRNGVRRVEVEDDGGRRRVQVEEGPRGIDLTITGTEGGEPVTARFRARTASELRDQDPDAYRVYQRWSGHGMTPFVRGRRLFVPQAGPQQFGVVLPPPAVVRGPADDLGDLQLRVVRQLNEAKAGEEQQRDVLALMEKLQRIQANAEVLAPADWNQQIQRYNALSDALREKLDALKLPDPGDALPPPAKARLGISVGATAGDFGAAGPDEGVTVTRVVPDSRGERVGLKEADVIRTVNGKAIGDTRALRRALTEANGPLVLEVTRDGKPQTLREKPMP